MKNLMMVNTNKKEHTSKRLKESAKSCSCIQETNTSTSSVIYKATTG